MSGGQEFCCVDCRRLIIAFPAGDPVWSEGRCSACQTMPGWYNDPQLRRIFEPDKDWLPPSGGPSCPPPERDD
jgi:hypothetical protein